MPSAVLKRPRGFHEMRTHGEVQSHGVSWACSDCIGNDRTLGVSRPCSLRVRWLCTRCVNDCGAALSAEEIDLVESCKGRELWIMVI